MFHSRAALPDATYLEVVRSIYATMLPTAIIAVSFIGAGTLIAIESPDLPLDIVIALGMAAVAGRIVNLFVGCRRIADPALDIAAAHRLERRFAFFYFAFAVAFSAFAVRVFQVGTSDARMIVIGLLFGYGAGVAAGIAMRPWIAIPSILIAVVPASITISLTPSPDRIALALLLLLFLGGGIHSILLRSRNAVRGITMRRTYEALARSDDLTGLRNRLSLREGFEQHVGRVRPAGIVAVHCLDLDKFKPVNDRYGHPAGDALLRAVSERLNGLLRKGDIAARLGGDEFAILQTGASHPGEAELLARRIVREIAKPFSIDGHRITIGTSVGYAISPEHGDNLEILLARADEALCRIKSEGGGIAAYAPAQERNREESRRLSA
jgi:diguanylate cyclase (GGDEF)-like protein